jgi:hypothetical protein
MNDKQQMLTNLKAEFDHWEELLAGLSEDRITAPQLPADLSIKDVIGHLRAWQQVSIARVEAAYQSHEPLMPDWLASSDPEQEENLEQYNARIYETYHPQPWPQVYHAWKEGFLRFLQLGQATSENDLMDTEKYPWLKGYALIDVLKGSYEHHHIEHFEPIQAWLRQHQN